MQIPASGYKVQVQGPVLAPKDRSEGIFNMKVLSGIPSANGSGLDHTAMSDGDLVYRVLAGEKELFAVLMRRYNQTLYRAVHSYLDRRQDVEDVMQEAYIKAYGNLVQFEGRSSFATWLVRIGINEALQFLRRTNTIRVHSDPILRAEQLSNLPDSDRTSPEQRSMNEELHRILEDAIGQLPAKYRSVYMLREVEGMNVADTASSLGLTEANVKVRLHRAKTLLKDSLWQAHVTERNVFEFGNQHCDALVAAVMSRVLSA